MLKRKALSAGLAGLATASWAFHNYLWRGFLKSNPRTPQPATGFTYVINNHGSYYYLTAIQATQLGMMVYLAGGAFVLAIIADGRVPKKQACEVYAKQIKVPAMYMAMVCGNFDL
jgi:hypothetical protein